jgi:hypothetical protein
VDRRQGSGTGPGAAGEAGGKSEVDDGPAWIRLLRDAEPDWAQPVGDRVEELVWTLDHLADLDADFLAIYGIDLDEHEISAPRYFALAHRLTAYQGVMAARVEEEQDQSSSTTTRTSSTQPAQQGGGGTKEVSLTAFRVMFPGIVSGGG